MNSPDTDRLRAFCTQATRTTSSLGFVILIVLSLSLTGCYQRIVGARGFNARETDIGKSNLGKGPLDRLLFGDSSEKKLEERW